MITHTTTYYAKCTGCGKDAPKVGYDPEEFRKKLDELGWWTDGETSVCDQCRKVWDRIMAAGVFWELADAMIPDALPDPDVTGEGLPL